MNDEINDHFAEASGTPFPKTAEEVIDWLITTRTGHTALLDAVFSDQGQALLNEILDRQMIHVLVKVFGDGVVEVMASDRRVLAQIVSLPPFRQGQDEGLLDELCNLLVKGGFRQANYWPTNRRASDKIKPQSTAQWASDQAQRDFELIVLEGLK